MSYDVSNASFTFRFTGNNAEAEAQEFYDELPTGESVNEISRKVVADRNEIFFVYTNLELDATPEYVQAVLDVMTKHAPEVLG